MSSSRNGIASTKSFAKFGRSVEQIGRRFKATEAQTRDLGFQIKELGKDSIFSTDQLQKALSLITVAGTDTTGALNILNSAMALASATGIELTAATTAINNVGLCKDNA